MTNGGSGPFMSIDTKGGERTFAAVSTEFCFADFAAVHCFPFKGRFQFIHRSQQPLGSAIDLG